MIKRDITDEVGDALRAEALRRNSRFYLLEHDTWMLRNDSTLSTQFFLDEADAAGQLLEGKPPKRRPRQQRNSERRAAP